jgi:predicted unusual protein kinase regulating ubiquinone biosynthesis (AarF/ABC1/UbiB family)
VSFLSTNINPEQLNQPTASQEESGYIGEQYKWNRENYSINRRRFDIWRFVLLLMLRLWLNGKKWSYPGGYSQEKLLERQKTQAAWIKDNCLELGPTFIKVGQLFSTRADLFPGPYVGELTKLQDQVPAFGFEQVCSIIEKDLGRPIHKLFLSFDKVPIAAASLGQVHKAQLLSGEVVVVKVQRPGLKQLFTIDLEILKKIAQYFQNHPRWGKGRDWAGIYQECCRILWLETDYLNEGRNADIFRRNFRDHDWVKVPRVYWRYTSRRVLTLEYVPGIKISQYQDLETAGLDRKVLARLGAKSYLEQILHHGFFHADPHPGNLAVNEQGALIFYDFGMMGEIKTNVRQGLMDVLFGIAERSSDRVVGALINLGALTPTGDMAPVRRSIQFILENLMDKPFEEQSVSSISEDLYEIAYDQPFRFPATFTFVMRAFSTLEGVGKGLDPDFNFMEVAQPFAMELMTSSNNGKNITNTILDELGRQAVQVSNSALGLPRRIEDTIEKLERGDIRLRVRSNEAERLMRRLHASQITTNFTMMICTLVISATILFIGSYQYAAGIVLSLTIIPIALLIRVLKRSDRVF